MVIRITVGRANRRDRYVITSPDFDSIWDINGMFVKDIVGDPIDNAMVKSINEIGHVMGMKTIAEFVENDAIKDMLREIGVDYAQGYGIGKPKPFIEILDS